MKTRLFVATVFVLSAVAACGPKEPEITPAEIRAVAKEAYVYGFPLVDGYRVLHSYFVDTASPDYKGPWNELISVARVYTPEDRAVQTPNSDTPYSFLGADLRSEPLVLTIPAIDKGRYYSLQFIDLYTYNFAYVGTRATGNDGGVFMLAGPGWQGETPPGITAVIRSETELALVIYRTQLFDRHDIDEVKDIQVRYKVQPLSRFLGETPPERAPDIEFMPPLSNTAERKSLEFFSVLNWILQFCPRNPSEDPLMVRFARIGVGAGKTFDVATLEPGTRTAMEAGMADAWAACDSVQGLVGAGKVASGDCFGTRAFLGDNYLYRMTAAVMGIYGNSKQEAMYPVYLTDSGGQPLDAAAASYTLTFAKGQLPPVDAFWSITMYDATTKLLVANPLERYLISSSMVKSLKKAKDGSITIYLQYASPGPGRQANWLPAPNGPFFVVLRLYQPQQPALDGKWKQPPLERVKG